MKLAATARTVDRNERTRAQARKAARKRKESAEDAHRDRQGEG